MPAGRAIGISFPCSHSGEGEAKFVIEERSDEAISKNEIACLTAVRLRPFAAVGGTPPFGGGGVRNDGFEFKQFLQEVFLWKLY